MQSTLMDQDYKIVDQIQGSDEWLVWRRGKITASMAGTILGIDKYKTPLQLYNQILCGEEEPDNEFMKHGRDTEPEARAWIGETTGNSYEPVCMESKIYPWMAASLDGWNEANEIPLLEIKCTKRGMEKFSLALLDEIPPAHFAQIQHQMVVSGASKACYCTYSKESQDGVIITIKRNDEFIENMIVAEKAFYNRLLAFDPPDPIDGRDILEISDPESLEASEGYMMACNRIQLAEIEKERYRKILIEKANGKSARTPLVKITKVVSKGQIQYKNIPEIQNIDLEPYRKQPIISWRIS